tara:strand:- start:1687 stop:2301 length:615 start_codon:yes stop_codon:yes gene_type:complete
MSIIRADSIKNRAGNGAPDFPNGITVTGVVTSTVLDNNVSGDLTISGNLGVGGTVTYEDVTNIDAIGIITARSGIQIGAGGTIGSSGGGIVTFFGDGSNLTGIDATALKDGSGNVIVQASASAVSVTAGKHLNPASTNTTDLGTTSLRWRNLYTQDLQLSNESSGGNDVDGTWGNWTLQEGETDIFMINNRTGKKFKINMTEVD